MTEKANVDVSDHAIFSSRPSVFDRLEPLTPEQRPSVFSRMEQDKTPKSSIFHRLKGDKQLKSSIFTIIKIGGKSSSSLLAQDGNSMFSRLGEVNEVQSSVPSRMKRISALDIKTDGSLKINKYTLVITSCEASSNSNGKIKDEEQASSHLVVVQEADNLKAKTEVAEASETSKNTEDFQYSPTNGKFLKCYFP